LLEHISKNFDLFLTKTKWFRDIIFQVWRKINVIWDYDITYCRVERLFITLHSPQSRPSWRFCRFVNRLSQWLLQHPYHPPLDRTQRACHPAWNNHKALPHYRTQSLVPIVLCSVKYITMQNKHANITRFHTRQVERHMCPLMTLRFDLVNPKSIGVLSSLRISKHYI